MLSLKILSIKNLPILILILCLVSISTEITFLNKIFWITLVFISYFLLKFNFKFKNLLIGGYALIAIYIQLRFDQFVFSEEFFLNCLAILIIAIAIVVLRVRHMEILNRRTKKLSDD